MQNVIKNQSLFFISLVGIILVSSIMIYTYAYQTLRVDYVSGSKETLTVTSGVLDVEFKVTNNIDIKNMLLLPSYKTSDYIEFVIDNTKSTSEVAYQISLVELEYSDKIANGYFRYTIVKVNDDNTEEVISNGSFANLSDNYIDLYFDKGLYNYVDASSSHRLKLYLWFKESKNVDQSSLLNTYFKGKISVNSIFSSDVSLNKESSIFEVGTLADKLISNAMLGLNGTKYSPNTMTRPLLDTNEVYESTLSKYEETYYYRGNVKDNYVNFNNKCFRVVSISNDGSVKLVLEDDKNICENIDITNINSGLISNESGTINVKNNIVNKLVGDNYLLHKLNSWYESNNFTSMVNYLKLDSMCHNVVNNYTVLDEERNKNVLRSYSNVYGYIDKKLVEMTEDNYKLQCKENIENNKILNNEDMLYCNEWYYDIYRRLYGLGIEKNVTLTCNDNEKVESYVNILSPDELILAGYVLDNNSNTNYLSNSKNYWTSSIAYTSLDKDYMFYVNDNLLTKDSMDILGIRPTITLNNTILYESGNGTKDNPYVVKVKES